MKYDVMKPFNTVNRRLAIGAEISTDDPIEPFTFEEREKSGFIKEKPALPLAPPVNKLVLAPAPDASPIAAVTADK